MASKRKQKQIELEETPILEPVDIKSIGSNNDPCFGKEYNLSTKECKMCGDSELCCIKFAELMGKTRKKLESETQFKDLESLINIKTNKKTIRQLRRKGDDRKTIIDKIQAKYELTKEEARTIYRIIKKQLEDGKQ